MPQYIVICKDHDGIDGIAARLPMRPEHLKLVRPMSDAGQLMLGAGIFDSGKLIGSMSVFNFPDRAALDDYLARDPYRKIWKSVEVNEAWVKFFGGAEQENPA